MFKRNVIYVMSLACLASDGSLARVRADAIADPAMPPLSRAQIQKARDEGVDLGKVNTAPGLHVVPLSESWSTPEHADVERKHVEQQRLWGFYSAEASEVAIPRFKRAAAEREHLPRHDRAFASLQEIQNDILVKPIGLGSSGLSAASLLEVRLGGSHIKGKWTGLARSFDVPELGLVILNETDHAAGKESVTMVKEWVNIEINGQPGTAKTARDASGHTLVTVGWANDRKLYSLQLQPLHPEAHAANQEKLIEIARKLVEA